MALFAKIVDGLFVDVRLGSKYTSGVFQKTNSNARQNCVFGIISLLSKYAAYVRTRGDRPSGLRPCD